MGLKNKEMVKWLRAKFGDHCVPYSRVGKMPHIIDASGVFYTWLSACKTLPEAHALAHDIPEKIRQRFTAASEFFIATDARPPRNKVDERAERAKKNEVLASSLGVDLTETIEDPVQLPGTLRTLEIAHTLSLREMTLAQLLDLHAGDAAIVDSAHSHPWDKVLMLFALRGLVRKAIQACRDAGIPIIDDPEISPEGEIGAVRFFVGSTFDNVVIVSNDTDFFPIVLQHDIGARGLFYYDLTLYRHQQKVYDIASTLSSMPRDMRRRIAYLSLFLGCDYIHWETPRPSPCRLHETFSFAKSRSSMDAIRYLANLDWRDNSALVDALRQRNRDTDMDAQMLRTEWAMQYYAGDPRDPEEYGWNADGFPV